MTSHRFFRHARVTQRLTLVEQERLSSYLLNSTLVLLYWVRIAQSLAVYVLFCRLLLVCSILPLSVLYRFTASEYLFGIFIFFLDRT